MNQMLAMVVHKRQDDWDLSLPHVEFVYNNSISAATGLKNQRVPHGQLPRLPLTGFDRSGVVGHQSLARDHLAYCDLATDRKTRANYIVRAHHALTLSRLNSAETPPWPTRCVQHLTSLRVVGNGCTTLPLPSARV